VTATLPVSEVLHFMQRAAEKYRFLMAAVGEACMLAFLATVQQQNAGLTFICACWLLISCSLRSASCSSRSASAASPVALQQQQQQHHVKHTYLHSFSKLHGETVLSAPMF
jgi:hypothetical protein